MDITHAVKILEGKRDLGKVELGKVLLEDVVMDLEEAEEISSRVIVHHKVERSRVLKRVVELCCYYY